MNKAWLIRLTVWATTLGSITGGTAAPANGSFEAGGFAGWSLQVAQGRTSARSQYRAAGTASITSAWGQPARLNPAYAALDGSQFALLGTLANGNFTGHRTYHISLNQQIFLNQGDTLSGWSFFFNGDYEAQDSAWVKLLDCDGNLLATPWHENSGSEFACDLNSTPFQTATPWTQWSWQAPTSGNYLLSLGVTTSDDNNYASYGGFDHIFVAPGNAPIAVPEPAAATLVLLSAVLLAQLRRTRN